VKPRQSISTCFVLTVAIVQATAAVDIWLPRQHIPAFVQPGGNFTAEVRGASSLSASGWSAAISNELTGWNCSVASASYGTIHQGRETGWRLSISVPPDAPPELFTLTVANSSGGSTNRVGAVKVVRNFEESFYILQLTDQHVTETNATVASGNHYTGNGSTDAMHWAAPAINLINPRFVLITGDNNQLYFSATTWCGWVQATNRIRRFYKALQDYTAPAVVVDGNHDVGYSSYTNSAAWRAAYEDLVGQRVFSFRMGSFYVLGNEFTYDDDLRWARTNYNAAYADASIKYRLIAQHYPAAFVQVAFATNPCDLMLCGHTHVTQTYQTTPYPIQISGTSQDYEKASFYDFQRGASGWTCAQATHHLEGTNVWHLFGDWGSNPVVSATFSRTNNGTQTSNTVSIVNTLPQDFYNGRVKFLMAHGTYLATNGVIEAQYDYRNGPGTNTAVLVKINIRKNATTIVSVKQADPALRPRFGALKLSAGSLVLNGTGGVPGGRYYLLNSTSVSLPLANWTCMATNLYSTNGNFNLTNVINPSAPRQFYVLCAP
jgi:predicted MPP superfamily phosphohydrolase